MSAHQWRSQEIYAPDGTCIRVVTWHQPGSPHGDWRGTLTRPTYAPDGVQTVHVCCQAYASSELAIITRCATMARVLLGLPLPGTATVH
jgi:hypothetical protein